MTPAEIERIKDILPTSLGSDEIRQKLAADILRRSVFSARMSSAAYLVKVREVCALLSEGKINQAEAEARLLSVLNQLGYDTDSAKATDIRNPASERRIKLILDTQRQMAASVATLMRQDEGTVAMFPGWELCRVGSRTAPRPDWLSRWRNAGNAVGWKGARRDPIYGDATAYGFLALKPSPIWQALGNGAGGFKDSLQNPYPPFAYSSGMGWLDADRDTCVRYGLINPDDEVDAPEAASLSPDDEELREACERVGFDITEGL